MIRKYTFGHVIKTGAILIPIEPETDECPFIEVNENKLQLSYTMEDEARVYGLGEQVRGLNKRGWIYESNNSDNSRHLEDAHALYGSHNFLLITGGEDTFGMFIDYPGHITWDIGYTWQGELTVTLADWNFNLYFIEGTSAIDIVRQFRKLIGPSYIAPRWGLGLGQSRWSYMTADEVREVVDNYETHDLPLDAVYLDIDYMNEYEDFTVNGEAFPDFPGFVEEMREHGIHLVPIIDAGVKKKEGYSIYDEGMEKGYFCLKEDGTPFEAAVWPGESVFPDFLNSKARSWFGSKYKFLLDQGIDGFWNDMNEPALFYTPKRLEETIDWISGLADKKITNETWNEFMQHTRGISNNPEDYKTFYHNIDGKRVRHDKVHNLYGYNMTRAAGETFYKERPRERILMFSRSSYIGAHRYGGIWQGDNHSWWSHIKLNLCETISLNMCGFVYTGADLGGFGSNATEDLILRWLALGVFTPLMRTHSAWGTRHQEPYCFEDFEGFRHVIGLRYHLLPYIYSEYMKACLSGNMMFRPLAFDYPDDRYAVQIEDQAMIGDEIMIAPVYEQNARGRYVYIPERMKLFRFSKGGAIDCEILDPGHYWIKIELTDVVLFMKENHFIPFAPEGGFNTGEVDFENPRFLDFVEPGQTASYVYYIDDGYSRSYEKPEHFRKLVMKK